eukprot:jgi/Mesvir1/10753/Mv13822-RA.1
MVLKQPRLRAAKFSSSNFFPPSSSELDLLHHDLENEILQRDDTRISSLSENGRKRLILSEILDVAGVIEEGVSAIVDDSFTKCFTSTPPEHWNWNWYLFPLYFCGVIVRYLILFPLRLTFLLLGWVVFLVLFFPVHIVLKGRPLRFRVERLLVEMLCHMFVASWTGVIKYHGPRPSRKPNQVFVANHTSMIDFIILEQVTPFAVIMQIHKGWVGFTQKHILSCLGCIWFNRTEYKDRKAVSQKLKEHIADPNSNPLLIFPEGTCVNNEYCVMFKKGVFELGAAVCPIAIKYNKIFVDAFWNSRKQSFTHHLLRLMTSWAVVCDVWYLEPQTQQEGETPEDFADRVKRVIAQKAGIKPVPWDGYLKYYRPSEKLTEKRQKKFSDFLQEQVLVDLPDPDDSQPQRSRKSRLGANPPGDGSVGEDTSEEGSQGHDADGAGGSVRRRNV